MKVSRRKKDSKGAIELSRQQQFGAVWRLSVGYAVRRMVGRRMDEVSLATFLARVIPFADAG